MDQYKTSLPNLEFLEVMIINACNLACTGCTTFSDLKHSGYVTWQQGHDWIAPWTSRLNIQAIGVMGGEPLMNPELKLWLIGIRDLLPHAQIRFVTNGLLLHKNWWVLDLLDDLGNAVFKITQHVEDTKITEAIDYIMSSRTWRPVQEYGIDRWASDSGLRFQVTAPKTFLKTFRGGYTDLSPHNSVPSEAFAVCVQKRCPLLIDGAIWKCGTAALTPRLLEKFNWPNAVQWDPFVIAGLDPTCTEDELDAFISNFGKPHSICRQCPSKHDADSFVDHSSTVTFK